MPRTRYLGSACARTSGWTISKPAYIKVRTSLAVRQEDKIKEKGKGQVKRGGQKKKKNRSGLE